MKRASTIILKILGVFLIILASLALFLGLWMMITGQDGFTDAAPWWAFLYMIAVVLGLPGLILLIIAHFISKQAK